MLKSLTFWIVCSQFRMMQTSSVSKTVNGHLLVTETLDQNKHQVIFKRIGELATDVNFHHIHIPVQMADQIGITDQAKKIISRYTVNIYQETLMHYHQDNRYPDEAKAKEYAELLMHQNNYVANSSDQILEQIKESLISMTEALPQYSSKMSKSQQELLFGLIGTAFSTINSEKISKIEDQISEKVINFEMLTHISEIQDNPLNHLDLKIIANEKETLEALRHHPAILSTAANLLVFKTYDVSKKILATVEQAQNNKLSTQLLQGQTINKMFNFLEKAAASKGMQLMIKKATDLFQTELSYFYKPLDKVLNLFLHVPMVHPDNLLQFFQMVPFPVSTSIKPNSSMIPKLEEDLLAVGPVHQFQTVGQSDLQSCHKFGTSYLCQGHRTTRTDLENTCIGAYYLERWSVIPQLCQFQFIPATEHVLMISSNQWIISAPEPFSTVVKCNKEFSTINLKSLSKVTVPEGCTMHLKTHVIHPGSYVPDTDIEVKHFQWTWEPSHLFPSFNTKAFNSTMKSLKESTSISIQYINNEVRLKQDSEIESIDTTKALIQEHKEKENIQVHPNIVFYISITIIIIVFVICAMMVKMYYIIRRKHARACYVRAFGIEQ